MAVSSRVACSSALNGSCMTPASEGYEIHVITHLTYVSSATALLPPKDFADCWIRLAATTSGPA